MGGPGSGGRRPGTGSKPKWPAIDGGMGQGSEGGAQPVVVECPPDLAPEARRIWEQLAPLAAARQTLNPSTALSFEMLCRNIVLERAIASDPERAGGADHRGMAQRVDAELLRFDLSPNGKPHGELVNREKPKSALEKLKERRANLQAV